MDPFVALFIWLIGSWLPATLFYGLGLYALLCVRRAPLGAVAWGAAFAALWAYAIYDDVVRKNQFEARAAAFRAPATYAEVPADVRTIVFSRDGIAPFFTDLGQQCAILCAKLLLGGRFDRVIIPHKDYNLFAYDANLRDQALRRYRGPEHYRIYEIVKQPGCKNFNNSTLDSVLRSWMSFGRCISETRRDAIEGRRLEIAFDQDAPDKPPWPVEVKSARIVGDGAPHDVARIEEAAVSFALPFPIPGVFMRDERHQYPVPLRAGLFGYTHSYGETMDARTFLAKVLRMDLDPKVPPPSLETAPVNSR
jgi:hypothetical protein